MADTPTLVRFYMGYEEQGTSEDGMPVYVNVEKITLSRPPYLEVNRTATEEEKQLYPDAYRMFRNELGLDRPDIKGYPLDMWPACPPAERLMLGMRNIYTVEQLAQLALRRNDQSIPPSIREISIRAAEFIKLQGNKGQFEQKIHDLTAQRDELVEQVNELKAALSTANTTIETLKLRAA